MFTLHLGDCVGVMQGLDEASIDAIVTDPPYGLEFMGKEWDRPWAVSASNGVGYEGRDDLVLPTHRDNRNANCRACGGRQRGAKRCTCAAPAWDRNPNTDMVEFQWWCEEWAEAALRVLKPGGHLLAFGGTRTYHRMACAVEDAGFEIRDSVEWLYGSGFPKSLDVSKALDKAAGATREVIGVKPGHEDFVDRTDAHSAGGRSEGWERPWREDPEAVKASHMATGPSTELAKRWDGWGTALKPSHEPIVVARKPLIGTVAQNVTVHGTGGVNIDATRTHSAGSEGQDYTVKRLKPGATLNATGGNWRPEDGPEFQGKTKDGRWPANTVLTHSPDCISTGTRQVKGITGGTGNHDGGVYGARTNQGAPVVDYADEDGTETVQAYDCAPDCSVAELDRQSGARKAGGVVRGTEDSRTGQNGIYGTWGRVANKPHADEGGASRFFPTFEGEAAFLYCAKASGSERNKGLAPGDSVTEGPMAGRGQPGLKCRTCGKWKVSGSPCVCAEPDFEQSAFKRPKVANDHPTVKPIALMRWLVRLVGAPGATVLDPFVGSGTTGIAAVLEGCEFVGIDKKVEYLEIARGRIAHADGEHVPSLF